MGLGSSSHCALYISPETIGNMLIKMRVGPKDSVEMKEGEIKNEWVRGWREETREMGGGGRIEKGRMRGGVRIRESERGREREKNHISFIKFGFKNHNETPRHVDKNHSASIPSSFHFNDAMLALKLAI